MFVVFVKFYSGIVKVGKFREKRVVLYGENFLG